MGNNTTTEKQSSYDWLKERFPNEYVLGGAAGIFGFMGYRLMKFMPLKSEDVQFGEGALPVKNKAIEKNYKEGERIYITRFDERGCYVNVFAGEETHIPFSFFKGFVYFDSDKKRNKKVS